MSDINTITISGNLTRDPEAFGDGKVCRLAIASNRSFRKQGETEWTEEVTFVEVSAFSGLAKRILEKLRKGDKVVIDGRLELNRWDNADGDKRSMIRVIAQNAVAEGFFRPATTPPSQSEVEAAEPVEEKELAAVGAADEDIPF